MADPWASITDVAEIAGVDVLLPDLLKAQAVIETFVGRTSEATVLASDLTWLRRAVAYQAAWMADQPDLFSRTEVSSSAQDGSSATFRRDAHMLAPLAQRALKKLSWRGSRSIKVGRDTDQRIVDPASHWVGAVFDEGHERWVRWES